MSLATPDIVSVSLLEYGNAALTTRKLELFSLADVDPAVANIIAYNMADSLDQVAQNELLNGTNVIYADSTATGTVSLNSGDTIKAAHIRTAIARLRANKAIPRKGQYFWCGIHPEVSIDLRSEGAGTSNANWRDPHVYADSQNEIWAGEIGAFEGAYFVESPRLYSALDGKAQTATSVTSIVLTTVSGVQTATVTQTSHGYTTGDWVTLAGVTTDTFFNTDWQVTNTGTNTYTLQKVGTALTFGIADKTLTGTITAAKKTRVYRTFVAGQQALAEAVAEEPHVVIGPVVDRLMRFRPIGWYGVLGFKVYRNNALYRIESTSSIGSQVA